ncbi:MAG: AmmeMemoRadiSam system protein A, partial [Polyangia bacterium]|nr:AmmeMemoRadiSam system protein A [Polyangia bacterium]
MRALLLVFVSLLLAVATACKDEAPPEKKGAVLGPEGKGPSGEAPISPEDRKTLLKLARRSLVAAVSGLEPPALTDDLRISSRLKRNQGAFVTLKKHGQLRGCIGTILPRAPLYQAVIANARNAALHDSRFRPVGVSELDQIQVEISALSVPSPVAGPGD